MTDLAKFPAGASINGVPVLGGTKLLTTGTVFFVDSATGSNANDGITADEPFATLGYAYDQCTADKGDIIILMPSHAETITSTVALDTANVSIIGLGNGSKRPKLTQVTTGSDNLFEVSAAGIYMENIWLYDASVAGTAPEVYIDIASGGDDFTMVGCRLEQRTIVTEAVTIQAGANDVTFQGCEFLGTSIGPDVAIKVEGAVKRLKVLDCSFNYVDAQGCDTGNIVFEASKQDEILIKGCHTIGLMEDEEFVQALVGASTSTHGMIVDCFGKVEDLGTVIIQSNAFTVINSYFAESGSFAGPKITLNADENTMIPAATTIA